MQESRESVEKALLEQLAGLVTDQLKSEYGFLAKSELWPRTNDKDNPVHYFHDCISNAIQVAQPLKNLYEAGDLNLSKLKQELGKRSESIPTAIEYAEGLTEHNVGKEGDITKATQELRAFQDRWQEVLQTVEQLEALDRINAEQVEKQYTTGAIRFHQDKIINKRTRIINREP